MVYSSKSSLVGKLVESTVFSCLSGFLFLFALFFAVRQPAGRRWAALDVEAFISLFADWWWRKKAGRAEMWTDAMDFDRGSVEDMGSGEVEADEDELPPWARRPEWAKVW